MPEPDRRTARFSASALGAAAWGLIAGAVISCLYLIPGVSTLTHAAFSSGRTSTAPAAPSTDPDVAETPPRFADFEDTHPSSETRYLADWIADSGDNQQAGFVIVDKKNAAVYLFNSLAQLTASSPVLLGAARGDDSVPGIGSRPIAQVRPEERTTPAGRFVAQRGHNALGKDVIWVDYADAVSLHRVVTSNPAEHRLQRLASQSVADRRISYGCINVPAAFFDTYVSPMFAANRAVVYVMPEDKPLALVFNVYDVAAAHTNHRKPDDAIIPATAPAVP
jgi:hypothetical protein